MVSKITGAMWVIFAAGALLSLLSAPVLYGFWDQESVLPSFLAAAGFFATLVLMSLITLWIKGAQTNPSVLSGVFMGLLLAGGVLWLLGDSELGLVGTSVGASGLLITGLIVEISNKKEKVHH